MAEERKGQPREESKYRQSIESILVWLESAGVRMTKDELIARVKDVEAPWNERTAFEAWLGGKKDAMTQTEKLWVIKAMLQFSMTVEGVDGARETGGNKPISGELGNMDDLAEDVEGLRRTGVIGSQTATDLAAEQVEKALAKAKQSSPGRSPSEPKPEQSAEVPGTDILGGDEKNIEWIEGRGRRAQAAPPSVKKTPPPAQAELAPPRQTPPPERRLGPITSARREQRRLPPYASADEAKAALEKGLGNRPDAEIDALVDIIVSREGGLNALNNLLRMHQMPPAGRVREKKDLRDALENLQRTVTRDERMAAARAGAEGVVGTETEAAMNRSAIDRTVADAMRPARPSQRPTPQPGPVSLRPPAPATHAEPKEDTRPVWKRWLGIGEKKKEE